MKPEPLTPPDLDLRSFGYMPLEVVRLRDSDLVVLASGEEFRAAVLLWCAAWHQVPAGSVPKDERMLASLAGFGRDIKGWRTVSDAALRGFVECSDGRLYHPVIADIAITSGTKKRKQGSQTAAATAARRAAKELRDAERNGQRNDDRNDSGPDSATTDDEDRNVIQGRGSEENGEDSKGSESEKKGESNSRSGLQLVSDKAIPIDLDYEPSDRAVEYAYSLGMKKPELTSELSKFIAKAMTVRKVSFNPDMDFKLWCDRWLEFKLQKNPDWKPAPAPAPEIDRSGWPIVVEGTSEHTCWNIYQRGQQKRPLFLCRQIGKDGVIYERAAKCPTLYPPGFNDFGERLPPSAEDAA